MNKLFRTVVFHHLCNKYCKFVEILFLVKFVFLFRKMQKINHAIYIEINHVSQSQFFIYLFIYLSLKL